MIPERVRRWLPLVAAAISAVVVWVAYNPVPHSGGDNSGYVSLAWSLLSGAGYTELFDPARLPHTKYPPVYATLLAGFMAVGASSWGALKLSAAVPTVVAVLVTGLWASTRLGALGGFAVAVLVALSSGVVYYSQWILSDPLFLALTMSALWACARADVTAQSEGGEAATPDRLDRRWLSLGVICTGLAFFTRSAGLPLVISLLGWLVLRRAWREAGVAAAVLGAPMIWWSVRGSGEGVAQYGTEFWMVDPYDPAQGTIGLLGLFPRILENLEGYALGHIPAGIVGAETPALALVGVTLCGAALAGWLISLRSDRGVAELFFPLYTGLVVLWPTVWGGDRFALPLFPLLLLYGAVVLRTVSRRMPPVPAQLLAAGVVLMILVPAVGQRLRESAQGAQCRAVAESRGVWSCYGPRIEAFMSAAAWAKTGLPEGSVVLSRKPRHFFVYSGLPSRAFPFIPEPAAQLELADEVGARYVLLDQWDGLAARNVGGAVRAMPGAFCYIRAFGEVQQGGAQLLGILPPAARASPAPQEDGSGALRSCPPDYVTTVGGAERYSSSGKIPLLKPSS